MADLGTCNLKLYRERVGSDDTTNYETIMTLPTLLVKNISLDHSSEKQIQTCPPDADTGEENDPIILMLGVKSKNITISGTFEASGYIFDINSPPLEELKQNLIVKASDEQSRDNFPELDDGDGYWRIKIVDWGIDYKTMMWECTLTLSYIWTTYNESMFFGA